MIWKPVKAFLVALWGLGRDYKSAQVITLPKVVELALDQSIFAPVLQNDFLNFPVDRDLTAWRKLAIKFLPDPSAFDMMQRAPGDGGRVASFKTVTGEVVQCILPQIDQHHQDGQDIKLPTEDEKGLMIETATRALKNFSHASGGCLRHKEGWWTYELCHNKRARQYHVVTASERATMIAAGAKRPPAVDTVTSEFLLGRFLPNSPKATDVRFGNVFTMTYRDGDQCRTVDRGTVHRSTEVRFVCVENRLTPHFIDVFESSVCHYVMVIGTPALCSIPSFRSWSPSKQTIMCTSSSSGQHFSAVDGDASNDDAAAASPKKRAIKLDRLAELVDSGDSFPLLKQAILDLLQSEFGAVMPDSLTSHLPRRSLFDVFTDLKHESEPQSELRESRDLQSSPVNANEKDSQTSDEQEDSKKKRGVFELNWEL